MPIIIGNWDLRIIYLPKVQCCTPANEPTFWDTDRKHEFLVLIVFTVSEDYAEWRPPNPINRHYYIAPKYEKTFFLKFLFLICTLDT